MAIAAGEEEQHRARILCTRGQRLLNKGDLPAAREFFKEAIMLDRNNTGAYEHHAFAIARGKAQLIFEMLKQGHINRLLSGNRNEVAAVLLEVAPLARAKNGSWEACFGAALFYSGLARAMCGADYDCTMKDWLEEAGRACVGRKSERLMKMENMALLA